MKKGVSSNCRLDSIYNKKGAGFMADQEKEDITAMKAEYVKFGNYFYGMLESDKLTHENVVYLCSMIQKTLSDFLECAYNIDKNNQKMIQDEIPSFLDKNKSEFIN